jgi:hypothetical protein
MTGRSRGPSGKGGWETCTLSCLARRFTVYGAEARRMMRAEFHDGIQL